MRERVRCVHGNLFAYTRHKQMIEDFLARAMRQNGKRWDGAGTRGSFRSDPAARGGLLLADPPERIRIAMEWAGVVEDAWAECLALDGGNLLGMAYMMEVYFCLSGKRRDRKDNAECRKRICEECGISKSTFYAWLERITDIVSYHAARRNLI